MEGEDKPNVLMLHGFLGGAENWRACRESLLPVAHVSTPVLPYLSGSSSGTESVNRIQEFLTAMIQTKGRRPWVLMGNSLGGTLAVHLALKNADCVAGLVLAGSGGFYRPSGRRLPRHPDREWLRKLVEEVFFDPRHATEEHINELAAIAASRERARQLVRVARVAVNMSVRELLPQVRCPVLLVWGEQDVITPPDVAHNFHRLLPRSELHFIPRCGHAPMMEQPEEFNRLAVNFVRRFQSRARAVEPAYRQPALQQVRI